MSNDKIQAVGVNIAEKATMIWNVADMLRDPFKPHEYGLVILPMTVVKRFHDCLLPTHEAVLAQYEKVKKLAVIDGFLTKASGYQFYNTSKFTFEKLLADPDNIEANFRDYLAGFSPNVQDVLSKFDFDNIIKRNSMNVIIGSVGISHYFGCVSPVYYVFKETEDADLRFISYIFSTVGFQKELRKYAKGIMEIRLRISVSDTLRRVVPLPKLEEQSLPGIMLIQHPAVLSENMVSLYFFLSPQRCRISHRRQCASLLHWNLTIPPSLWPDRELRKYHCPCLALAPPPVAIRHLLLRNRYRPDGLHGVQSMARPNRNVPEE